MTGVGGMFTVRNRLCNLGWRGSERLRVAPLLLCSVGFVTGEFVVAAAVAHVACRFSARTAGAL